MPEKSTGAVGDPAAEGETKTVPLSALESVRAELKQAKESGEDLKNQVELYKANAAATQNSQTQTSAKNPLEGLDDGDVVTVADVKRIMGDQEIRFSAVAQQLKAGQAAPDYEQVIEKYLPHVIAKNPELANAIKTSNNPLAIALQIAKSSDAYRKDQQEANLKNENAQTQGRTLSEGEQILANQNRPNSASAGAGVGGGVSAVDKVLAMTDDELEAKIAEIGSRA